MRFALHGMGCPLEFLVLLAPSCRPVAISVSTGLLPPHAQSCIPIYGRGGDNRDPRERTADAEQQQGGKDAPEPVVPRRPAGQRQAPVQVLEKPRKLQTLLAPCLAVLVAIPACPAAAADVVAAAICMDEAAGSPPAVGCQLAAEPIWAGGRQPGQHAAGSGYHSHTLRPPAEPGCASHMRPCCSWLASAGAAAPRQEMCHVHAQFVFKLGSGTGVFLLGENCGHF